MGRLTDFTTENRDTILLGFLGLNYLAMAVDCTLAHWSIGFYHWGMYLSALWPIPAGIFVIIYVFKKEDKIFRILLYLVSGISIIVGILGLIWHLLGQFLNYPAFSTLIYSAPIFGPIAITVLGIAILLYLRPPKIGLFKSYMLLSAISLFGITLMAYLDHMQNYFFKWTEWVPLFSGIFATFIFAYYGFNPVKNRADKTVILGTAGASFMVGFVGTILHLLAFISHPAPLKSKFALLAPPLAPIILCDAAIFVIIVGFLFEGREYGEMKSLFDR